MYLLQPCRTEKLYQLGVQICEFKSADRLQADIPRYTLFLYEQFYKNNEA